MLFLQKLIEMKKFKNILRLIVFVAFFPALFSICLLVFNFSDGLSFFVAGGISLIVCAIKTLWTLEKPLQPLPKNYILMKGLI